MSELKAYRNDQEVARILGVSVAAMRKWRLTGQGPRWSKLGISPGAAVRYSDEDIAAWLDSMPCGGGVPVHNQPAEAVHA